MKTKTTYSTKQLLQKAKALGIRLSIPKKRLPMRNVSTHSAIAPAGRSDIATIDFVRTGKEY